MPPETMNPEGKSLGIQGLFSRIGPWGAGPISNSSRIQRAKVVRGRTRVVSDALSPVGLSAVSELLLWDVFSG